MTTTTNGAVVASDAVTLHPANENTSSLTKPKMNPDGAVCSESDRKTHQIDRARFTTTNPCIGVKVHKTRVGELKKGLFAKYLLHVRNVRNVVEDPEDSESRILLLHPDSAGTSQEFSESLQLLAASHGGTLIYTTYTTGYEEASYHDILSQLLPEGIEIPAAFERVGHIARLTLAEAQLPFRYIIGQVILDTVVNKCSNVDTEYRTPHLELLAGERNYITETVENGIVFSVDYQNVYWNSRLAGERERLAASVPVASLICDVMSGVGSFAMYFAKKGCFVLSNDLNPKARYWVEKNARRNSVAHNIAVYNQDGRVFLRHCFNELHVGTGCLSLAQLPLCSSYKRSASPSTKMEPKRHKRGPASLDETTSTPMEYSNREALPEVSRYKFQEVHIVMNLPQIALEFLDALKPFIEDGANAINVPVFVHCYCFSRPESIQEDVLNRVQATLGTLPDGIVARYVRNVAPNKRMFCVEFAFGKTRAQQRND